MFRAEQYILKRNVFTTHNNESPHKSVLINIPSIIQRCDILQGWWKKASLGQRKSSWLQQRPPLSKRNQHQSVNIVECPSLQYTTYLPLSLPRCLPTIRDIKITANEDIVDIKLELKLRFVISSGILKDNSST